MNTDTLLTRIRLEQRSLIDINKKLYELERLLPAPAPEQFIETAKSAALLSEHSTAQLRNFLFTLCGGMPQNYYLQAAKMQGICVSVKDGILSVRLPALLPKKTRTEGFKFLQSALHTVLKQYAEQQNLPHFRECTMSLECISTLMYISYCGNKDVYTIFVTKNLSRILTYLKHQTKSYELFVDFKNNAIHVSYILPLCEVRTSNEQSVSRLKCICKTFSQ